jgi:hypothetical protein
VRHRGAAKQCLWLGADRHLCRCGGRDSNAYPYSDTDTDCYPNGDAYANRYAHAHSAPDADTYANCYPHTHSATYADTYSKWDTHSDPGSNRAASTESRA